MKTWFATKDGKIFSYRVKGSRYLRRIAGELKGSMSMGYITVRGDNSYKEGVHRLVWEYFNGPIPKGLVINHKNGIKTDNSLENLELVTTQENLYHAWNTGLMRVGRGEKANASKLTEKEVLEIRSLYSTGNYTQVQLGKMFEVDHTQISHIVRRVHWSHL